MAGTGTEGNYSGYDYVAFDLYPYDVEGWREHIRNAVAWMQEIIRKYNLKGGFFGELGASTQAEEWVGGLFAGVVVDEETQAMIFQIAFEEAWDNLSGFFICSWSPDPKSPYNFRGLKAEEVIRAWYTKDD
jgi:hypothetical protein